MQCIFIVDTLRREIILLLVIDYNKTPALLFCYGIFNQQRVLLYNYHFFIFFIHGMEQEENIVGPGGVMLSTLDISTFSAIMSTSDKFMLVYSYVVGYFLCKDTSSTVLSVRLWFFLLFTLSFTPWIVEKN